ncbi:MAG: hypothetical protein IPM76_16460 [Chloroflexi bacterium]|nr:hypothetical protein [Chloroflexota bacterium]
MAIELKAESDIRSRRICLFLSWTLPLPRLRLRLMRRLNTYPADADDGDCVFDWVPGAKLQLSSPDEIPLALEQDEVDGQWRGWGRLVDGDLTPEQVYYYRLFAGDETKTRFYSHQDWRRCVWRQASMGLANGSIICYRLCTARLTLRRRGGRTSFDVSWDSSALRWTICAVRRRACGIGMMFSWHGRTYCPIWRA